MRPTEQFRGRTKLRRPGFKARFGDQGRTEKFFYPNSDPKLAYWSTDVTSQHSLALGLKNGWLSVWSFSAPVDINNDGTPLNVIIWQGYGATGVGKMCGTDYAGSTWQLSYINQRAFVLTADRKSIDETQTRLVFGAPRGVPRSVDPQLPGDAVRLPSVSFCGSMEAPSRCAP